ncbi:hypothetical protein DFR29_111198 [Tahibacter aquaticus]|uniref:Uncharacterized protein n=1 Tax=Tahibacter aquaticus TaxID=520092 RepID=A0A4V3DLU1_9GAMM|nr:hypothetical protein DFR29_111198 [Tahibacter aquaticus]
MLAGLMDSAALAACADKPRRRVERAQKTNAPVGAFVGYRCARAQSTENDCRLTGVVPAMMSAPVLS